MRRLSVPLVVALVMGLLAGCGTPAGDKDVRKFLDAALDKKYTLLEQVAGEKANEVYRTFQDEDGVVFTLNTLYQGSGEFFHWSNSCDYASAWLHAHWDEIFPHIPTLSDSGDYYVSFSPSNYSEAQSLTQALGQALVDFPIPVHAVNSDLITMYIPEITINFPGQAWGPRLQWSTLDDVLDPTSLWRVVQYDWVDAARTGELEDPTIPDGLADSLPWKDIEVAYNGENLLQLEYDPLHEIYAVGSNWVCGNRTESLETSVTALGGTIEHPNTYQCNYKWTIGKTTWRLSHPAHSAPTVTRGWWSIKIKLTGFMDASSGYHYSQADVEALLGVTITIDQETHTGIMIP